MKKLLFITVLLAGAFTATAQKDTKFGVKVGVDFASAKVTVAGTSATSSETGFFIGGFATLGISEKFAVQPEVLYVAISDANSFQVPVLAKYAVAEQFSIMAGPSFNYYSDFDEDKFKVNIDAGASYQIIEEIDINAKYSIGFGDVAVSGFFVGAGYRF